MFHSTLHGPLNPAWTTHRTWCHCFFCCTLHLPPLSLTGSDLFHTHFTSYVAYTYRLPISPQLPAWVGHLFWTGFTTFWTQPCTFGRVLLPRDTAHYARHLSFGSLLRQTCGQFVCTDVLDIGHGFPLPRSRLHRPLHTWTACHRLVHVPFSSHVTPLFLVDLSCWTPPHMDMPLMPLSLVHAWFVHHTDWTTATLFHVLFAKHSPFSSTFHSLRSVQFSAFQDCHTTPDHCTAHLSHV